MLIEFRLENHRSLRDEQALTMEAVPRVGDATDPRPRCVSGYDQRLLSVAALYGANASGKSNVLSALAFMRNAILWSHRAWGPDEGVPRDPFAWGPKRNEPSLYEVQLIVKGSRYEYGFCASDDCFLEEWLYAWPKGKKQVWLEREDQKFRFGEHLKGENHIIKKATRRNALFISAAAQHDHRQITPIFSAFRSIQTVNVHSRGGHHPKIRAANPTLTRLYDEGFLSPDVMPLLTSERSAQSFLERFRTFLRNADVGVVDVRTSAGQSDDLHGRSTPHSFELQHQCGFDEAWLPLREESRGTQTLFRTAARMLFILQAGGVLLVDELEASLHPSLARIIVRQFNDPSTNPHDAQLIFTTHDTNLVGTTTGEPVLRRDQIWFTEKDDEGATVLYPMTDYKPRKAENLERGYLQGRYGAIPFLGALNTTGV